MIYNFTITNKSTLKFLKCEAMIRTLYRFIFDFISYKFLLYFITFHNSYSSFHLQPSIRTPRYSERAQVLEDLRSAISQNAIKIQFFNRAKK